MRSLHLEIAYISLRGNSPVRRFGLVDASPSHRAPTSPCFAIVAADVRTEVQRSDQLLRLIGPRGDAEAQDGVRKLEIHRLGWVPLHVARPVFDRFCGSGSTLIAC
jgi:hypothetical protein